MIKKKIFKLLASSLILPFSVNAINCVLKNNSNNHAINDLDKYSHANIENYGMRISGKKNFKLNLYLTSSTYNYFLAMLDERITITTFLRRFLGDELSSLAPQWQTVIKEIKDGLELKSTSKSYTKEYFWNVFHDWIDSTKGFRLFKVVYTGQYLENNIYPTPPNYNSQKAQLDFRRNGILLQFNFTYIVKPQKQSWYINPFCKAYPYLPKYDSLEKYYFDYSYIDKKWKRTLPLIPVDIYDDPEGEKLDVENLRSQIVIDLLDAFNLSYGSEIAKKIAISSDDFHKELHYGEDNAEIIHLKFYSKITPTPFLTCSKEIKLYLVKEF